MNFTPIDSITSLFNKKKITLLVTDSGLGGLSIFAEIADRLKNDPIFSQVSLIYYNAWPGQNHGYNTIKDIDERVRVFDRALEGMKKYRPDLIMIACNTLSVLFNQTAFSRRESIPVIDIVRFGVDMVFQHLSKEASSQAVILGTVTTIDSEVHRSRLIEKGISPDRLISQPCDQLATEIENGPGSIAVGKLVDTFMEQAAEKVDPNASRIYAALFCTHFGYCSNLFKEKLQKHVKGQVVILDPNRDMAAFLFDENSNKRYDKTLTEMRVVSRIIWNQTKIDAIAGIIKNRSDETAEALKHYEHIPDLFTF